MDKIISDYNKYYLTKNEFLARETGTVKVQLEPVC